MSVDDFLEYSKEREDAERKRSSLKTVGRVLDSRWMMAIAVLSVLAAIAWALHKRNLATTSTAATNRTSDSAPKVELLGVPAHAQVLLDGTPIDKTVFGVTAGSRHAVEVRDERGGVWRQVFSTDGPIALVVEIQEPFIDESEAKGEANPQD